MIDGYWTTKGPNYSEYWVPPGDHNKGYSIVFDKRYEKGYTAILHKEYDEIADDVKVTGMVFMRPEDLKRLVAWLGAPVCMNDYDCCQSGCAFDEHMSEALGE